MVEPRSILIVRLGAIGDVVHGLPLACRLRRGFPGARIAWLVGPAAAPVLDAHPAIDEVVIAEKRAPREFWRQCREAARGGKADVAIDLQGLFMSGLAAWLAGARRRLSFDRRRTRELAFLFHSERLPAAPADGPVVRQNLAFADALGAPEAPLEFRLAPSERARDAADAALGSLAREPFAALIVGAGKDANRPFPETLAAASRALARAGLAPVLVGGAADAADAAAIADRGAARSLVGRTDLATTLAVLARARVAIGGDTGPLHMAAATGTPVVALFGGANPRRTGPLGAPARVISRAWACAPCYRRRCPTDRGCLAAIGGEEVAAAARDLIGG